MAKEEKKAKGQSKTTAFGAPYYKNDPDLQALLYCEVEAKFERYSAADICFICDITGSMRRIIDTIKDSLIDFTENVQKIINTYPRVAFIGFRDKEDKVQIEEKTFETNPKKLVEYINHNFECIGGGDTCEDLVLPLKKALELDWRSDLIYIYLVIDAPTHGRSYHEPIYSDDYPDDDKEKLLEKLMCHYRNCRINLVIIKCSDICDKMIEKMKQNYNSSVNKLMVIELSHKDEMRKDFQKNFLITISNGIDASMSNSRNRNFRGVKRKTEASQAIEDMHKMDFTKNFSGKVHTGSIGNLDYEGRRYEYTLNLTPSEEFNCKISGVQLGAGMFSDCYSMTIDDDKGYVAKFQREIVNNVDELKPDIEGNSLAVFFAEKFNHYLKFKEKQEARLTGEKYNPKTLRVLPLVIMENLTPASFKKAKFFLAQRLMEGEYVKFNNNYGWVNKESTSLAGLMAQAFSHFTYEFSMGTVLIADIQGIVNETGGITITDPAIHSALYKDHFGGTNHGRIGIMRFFMTHKCNDICKKLYLTDPGPLKNDKLAKIKAEHQAEKRLDHLYGSFEEKINKWKERIRNFDPMKLPALEPIEEELSDDGKKTESGSVQSTHRGECSA